jgi:hypothetical protein
MDITCGFCNNKFILDKLHIKREEAKENPIVKDIISKVFGVNISENTYEYFLYCPKCHKKIARFDY